MSSSGSSSSSSSDSDDYREKNANNEAVIEVTEGYRLYLERKKQKRLDEKKRAAALSEGMEGGLKVRKVEIKDFPNYKRKLVVQNIPLEYTEE